MRPVALRGSVSGKKLSLPVRREPRKSRVALLSLAYILVKLEGRELDRSAARRAVGAGRRCGSLKLQIPRAVFVTFGAAEKLTK